MIGLWLLAGSLSGGVEGLHQSTEFDSPSPSVILSLVLQAEASGQLLWESDTPRATIHFHRAMRGFMRLWELGHRNAHLASRLAECHLRFKESAETIAWSRRGLSFDPLHEKCRSLLDRSRAEVRYPLDGESAKQLGPPVTRSTMVPVNPHSRFGLYFVGCLLLARGWMKRQRFWLALGTTGFVLSLGIEGWSSLEYRNQQRDWGSPTVVIRSPETILRSGNGTLYPPRVNQSLPIGLETKLLLKRGEWVQVELLSGLVGWMREDQGLIVEQASSLAR